MTRGTDERVATSNEAALRFRLRADGIADLADRQALRRFAAAEPARFQAAILGFAGIARLPVRLPLVHLDCRGADVPEGSPALLARRWSASGLAPALAAVLLDADLRPDDRLLVAGVPPWPWLAALTQGIAVILAEDGAPATLRAIAEAERASAVAAPAAWLKAAGIGPAPPSGPRGLYCED